MTKYFMKGILVIVMVVGLLLPTVSLVSAGRCAPEDLSVEEETTLIFMREEEKLARDVYVFFYNLYHVPVFRNVGRSEQRHMDVIKALLDRYDILDPVGENGPGEFTDMEIQALYDQFTQQGSESLEAALKVGVAIEQKDIADLQAALGQVDNRDITKVYLNLLKASGKHLNAFLTVMSKHGFSLEP